MLGFWFRGFVDAAAVKVSKVPKAPVNFTASRLRICLRVSVSGSGL